MFFFLSGPGKILIATGLLFTRSVKIFDPEMKTYCEMPKFPINTIGASGQSGSFFDNSGTLVPFVCGGFVNNNKGNCYTYEKEHQNGKNAKSRQRYQGSRKDTSEMNFMKRHGHSVQRK